jgi:hypothetical protein
MDNLVKCTTDGCETLCVFKPRRYGLCDACFAEYRRRYNVNYQRTYQIQYRSKIAIQQLDAYREQRRRNGRIPKVHAYERPTVAAHTIQGLSPVRAARLIDDILKGRVEYVGAR